MRTSLSFGRRRPSLLHYPDEIPVPIRDSRKEGGPLRRGWIVLARHKAHRRGATVGNFVEVVTDDGSMMSCIPSTKEELISSQRSNICPMKCLVALSSVALISMVSIATAQAPAGQAVGFGQFQHTVLDNDRSDFFYADAFGMTIRQVPGNPYGALPGDGGLTDTPPRSRLIRSGGLFGTAGQPGALSMEFVHFTNIETMPGSARLQDPGNASLILLVRDLDATVAAARKAGGTIVTSGVPILGVPNGKPMAIIRDPDGFLIVAGELATSRGAAGDGSVASAEVALTVDSLERAIAFYKKLGVQSAVPTTPLTSSMGTLKQAELSAQGTPVRLLLFEFQGLERKAFRKRLSDFGTPAMALTVKDCDAAATAVKNAGGAVYSTGGVCIHQTQQNGMPFNRAFVRDADGFLLEFLQRGNP